MIDTITKQLIDLVRHWFVKREKSTSLAKSVQGRFQLVFEEHGIHRNQIPKFFGHGITLQDVASPERLLECLDEKKLQDASDLFGVSLDWLKGADETIFRVRHYYKHVEEFITFIKKLNLNDKIIGADIYLSTDNNWGDDAVMIVSEPIGSSGADEVYRHHICGGWTHVYGKARADLVACAAILLNHNIYPRVYWVKGSVEKFATGHAFPSGLTLMKRDKRVTPKLSKMFRAEKWVTTPSDFEYLIAEGTFGRLTAISRWLTYYECGYLDVGNGKDLAHIADLFRARYKELGGEVSNL